MQNLLYAWPLVAHLVLVADAVPHWDMTGSCRSAPTAGSKEQAAERYKSCLEFEHKSRDQLGKNWSQYPLGDRIKCVDSIKWFSPTYSELLTCLEMKQDLKKSGRPEL